MITQFDSNEEKKPLLKKNNFIKLIRCSPKLKLKQFNKQYKTTRRFLQPCMASVICYGIY